MLHVLHTLPEREDSEIFACKDLKFLYEVENVTSQFSETQVKQDRPYHPAPTIPGPQESGRGYNG